VTSIAKAKKPSALKLTREHIILADPEWATKAK
jgi:hypothetical protein